MTLVRWPGWPPAVPGPPFTMMRPSNGQREHQQASPLKLLFILLLHYRPPLWSALSIPLAETLTPVCCCSEVSRTRQMGTLNSLVCNAECCLYLTGRVEASLTKSDCLIFYNKLQKNWICHLWAPKKMFYWLLERKKAAVLTDEWGNVLHHSSNAMKTPITRVTLSFTTLRLLTFKLFLQEKKRSAAPPRLTPLAVLHGGF